MQFTQSKSLLARAYNVIPSATQTFSKGPTQWPATCAPNYLVRGEGAWVWDADGNKFLDYLMALGPIILGYNDPAVNDAITRQLKDGIVFSQMHPLEVEVAEMLTEIIPCAEAVRFGKNGSDATTAAVRVSRAFTGRDRVAVCGYHGWHDWYIATTTRDIGVPDAVKKLTHTFAYNDVEALDALFKAHPGEFAAVVMEPMGVETPKEGYLQAVRDLCSREGCVLVFDEIVTGFRFALGGAQEMFGVTPDLACFGKAMANGMPLSAVVGRKDVMAVFDDIFFSGTFGGETLSLAACKATIEALRDNDGLGKIARFSDDMATGFKDLIRAHGLESEVVFLGLPVRSAVAFPGVDQEEALIRRTFLMQRCVARGLLYFCSHVPCAAHGPDELSFTLDVMDKALGDMAAALDGGLAGKFEGPPVQAIFRKQ